MKLERSFVKSEDRSKIDWAPNSAATYAVVNKDTPNLFGEYPGWKIHSSTGASISLTAQNPTSLGKVANWATHPLYAVKRKDTEQSSTYKWNYYNIQKPLVDFDSFFDGESLEQEDIVLYFNLGMHHVPDTFDMPNTMFSGAQSGITIRPQNYGTSNPSLATKQMVEVSEDGKDINYYGQKMPSGTLNLDVTNPDLSPLVGPKI
jgi:primary-amine oxidase